MAAIYAKLAEQAYENTREDVDNYEYISGLSTRRIAVYQLRDMNEIVIAIRGTLIKDVNDWVSDAHIYDNTLFRDRTFQDVERIVLSIIDQLKGYRIVLTGHSLGGSTVVSLLNKYHELISEVYAFGVGNGPREMAQNLTRSFGCNLPLLKNTKVCKDQKKIKSKLHIYTTGLDPISALSFSRGAQLVKPTNFNVHGLSNYTNMHGGSLYPSSVQRFYHPWDEPEKKQYY